MIRWRKGKEPSYTDVIQMTSSMASDDKSQSLAGKRGLQVLNITWEDSGRFKGSSVGPNISDMTIQVEHTDEKAGSQILTCMPVIRKPNFSDISADTPLDSFYLLVGNEKGQPLERVTLKTFLKNIRSYLTNPESWSGDDTSLLCDRDTHALTSAQACFLPIPRSEKATFNPVLFNYQSRAEDPAVLTILATREGTSVTVIDNERDGFSSGRTWGQRLFFNQNGERASLTGERRSDFEAAVADEGGQVDASDSEGMNLVLLIQVPLMQEEQPGDVYQGGPGLGLIQGPPVTMKADVEDAVIGHGIVEGPFTEIDGLPIVRDDSLPIRVTVQFYKATSNGLLTRSDVEQLADQIDRVYEDADFVGSLVTEGYTGRATEHGGPKTEPPGWWDDFWRAYEAETGQTREAAIEMVKRIRPGSYPDGADELREMLDDADRS